MPQTTCFSPPASVQTSAAKQRLLPWWSALGLCGFCSCASLAQPEPFDPFHAATTPSPAAQVAHPESVASETIGRSQVGRARLESTPVLPAAAPYSNDMLSSQGRLPGSPRPANRSAVQLVSNDIVQASNSDGAIQRVAADARTPAVCPDVYAEGPVFDDDAASPTHYPDEYLFDGGDRAYPITRNAYQMQGLETEDTIAEFQDEEGRTKIKKSNRVAIYAPRFGSVVSVSGPNEESIIDKVHGHVVAQGGVNLRSRTVTDTQAQNLDSVRLQTRLRANGVGTDVATGALNRGQGRAVSISVMNTHQSRGRLQNGQFEDNLRLNLLQGMQFAENWTRKENPIIEGHAVSLSQSKTVQAQADYTGIEDNGKRGDLRLHKTADKGVAAIGDVVTFTITYENRGDRELKKVSIIDNLTPRLEYLPEATSTSRPGKVEAEDNGEGSVVLRFVLDEPLPGRTKGSITFQARVR